MNKKPIVFFAGAFDILNVGHIKSFEMVKKVADAIGGEVVIGLNTDELIKSYKKNKSVIPYVQRKRILESIKYIDRIVPQASFSTLPSLKKYNVRIFMVCNDWIDSKREELKYMEENNGKLIELPYFDGMSSSEIKKEVIKIYG